MKVTGKLAKTDWIDAQILARFAGAVGTKPSVIPRGLQVVSLAPRTLEWTH